MQNPFVSNDQKNMRYAYKYISGLHFLKELKLK